MLRFDTSRILDKKRPFGNGLSSNVFSFSLFRALGHSNAPEPRWRSAEFRKHRPSEKLDRGHRTINALHVRSSDKIYGDFSST